MKWSINEILNNEANLIVDDDVVISEEEFAHNSGIHHVEDVHVNGRGYLDEDKETVYFDLHIDGTMICPDAITGEEIEVPLDCESQETYSFSLTDEDGVRIVEDEIDLYQAIVDAIVLEIPLQVSIAEEKDYPQGEGWKVYSEQEYQKSKENEIDPRLKVLMDYKEEQ